MKKIKLASVVLLCSAALALTGCAVDTPEPTPAGERPEYVVDGETVKPPKLERAEVLNTNRLYLEDFTVSEVKFDRADGSQAICFITSAWDGTTSLDCPEWAQQGSSTPETPEGKK